MELLSDIMAEISIPDSILYFEAKFDLGRLERLLIEFEGTKVPSEGSGDEPMEYTAEYPIKIFQLRDSEDPPLSLGFDGPQFYIRECYPVYYDLIFACLNSGEYEFLSVVGTPGAGKSLFYLYVVRRYQTEHPEDTVVAAAFDKDCVLIECWVYEPGRDRVSRNKIPHIDGAVYFYDGAPKQPPLHQKMVCFTYLNYDWIDCYYDHSNHTCLWLPPWGLRELLDANQVCGFGLSEETITNRFNFFGGSALFCLSTHEYFVDDARDALISQIYSIDSFDKLSDCLGDGRQRDPQSYYIFHSVPRISDEFPFVDHFRNTFACSKEMDALICDRLVGTNKGRYHKLIDVIRYLPEASEVKKNLFERFAHESMEKGGLFEFRSLVPGSHSRRFEIPPGLYTRVKAEGSDSITGVAILDDTVLLFQSTVTKQHPVSAHAICEKLTSAGKLDDFINGNVKEVFLIFLIPPESNEFRKQRITVDDVYNDEGDVRHVKQIRSSLYKELVEQGIRSVGKLREFLQYHKSDYSEIRTQYLADFDRRNVNAQYNDQIQEIAQYSYTLAGFGKREDSNNDLIEERFTKFLNQKMAVLEKHAFLLSQLDAFMSAG
jgi:hypothetical protein